MKLRILALLLFATIVGCSADYRVRRQFADLPVCPEHSACMDDQHTTAVKLDRKRKDVQVLEVNNNGYIFLFIVVGLMLCVAQYVGKAK